MSGSTKLRRFVAIFIDIMIAIILGFAPFVGYILPPVYLLLKDGMQIGGFKNRSVGKLAMGLKVVDLDGSTEKHTPLDSIKRNFLLIIPFMQLIEAMVLIIDSKGQRLGDRIADTTVVEG